MNLLKCADGSWCCDPNNLTCCDNNQGVKLLSTTNPSLNLSPSSNPTSIITSSSNKNSISSHPSTSTEIKSTENVSTGTTRTETTSAGANTKATSIETTGTEATGTIGLTTQPTATNTVSPNKLPIELGVGVGVGLPLAAGIVALIFFLWPKKSKVIAELPAQNLLAVSQKRNVQVRELGSQDTGNSNTISELQGSLGRAAPREFYS